MPKLSATHKSSLSIAVLFVVLLLSLSSMAAVEVINYSYDKTNQLTTAPSLDEVSV